MTERDPIAPDDPAPREAEERAAELRGAIRRHDHLYYVEARPQVADAEYDVLFGELKELEETFPSLITDDSPTQRVGAEPREEFEAVPHAVPMLSLDSSQEEEAIRRFDERVRKAVSDEHDVAYLLEPKLDGASIELVYEDGLLARAVTRGNGQRGEEVTANVRTIRAVPLRLQVDAGPAPALVSVRGEVMMRVSAFERFNERLVERGMEPYASPRNSAAGAIRQLDPRLTAARELDCLAYDVLSVRGMSFRRDQDAVEALRAWGFRVPERVEVVKTVEDVIRYHQGFDADREDLDYEIDGVVIKLDDLDARAELGATSHHPRWAMAFKFEPRKEVTRVERIAISVGRMGALTPVALLRPVQVGGVTISRASLHNREEVARKDVRAGDLVRVQRAGDVIPQVVERIEEPGRVRGEAFAMPSTCPACRTEVVEEGPRTVCPNRFGCPAQLRGRLVHFGSRNALDIEGLGAETAALLVECGLVVRLADLFGLETEALLELPGFAEVSAGNLVEGIRRRMRPELGRLLFALGVPEVGVTVARDLAAHFGDLGAVREASREQLEEVPGIGPKMSETIRAFLDQPENARALDEVLARGVEPVAPDTPVSTALAGTRFVFTGGLERLTRAGARAMVEAAGARAVSSVSSETDYVVVGTDPGTKHQKALELGLRILSEDEFVSLMSEAGVPGTE